MGEPARILIVCTGNICRSPFIERLLQRELDARGSGFGQGGIIVRSAGTGALVGSPMDPQAAAQLLAHGGDPSGFRARELTTALIAESDLVLTATRQHRGRVTAMLPAAMRRVFTFCDFADLVEGIEAPGDLAGAGSAPSGLAHWVRQLTEKAAASRGLKPPLQPDLADIVDPYRLEDEVFATMAQQIVEPMPVVVRSLVA
ncbi:MAG: low molecular weight phosphatase family protein [Actinomycetota bacterium]